jgi:methanogenic corrinoid protein MtbC1
MPDITTKTDLINHSFDEGGLPIAAVERETGLGKDVLRVWEKRYGFPQPIRDSSGDRVYSLAQVQQLKLLSRLLSVGMRPSKVVGLSSDQLQALLAQHVPMLPIELSKTSSVVTERLLADLLSAIENHDPLTLLHRLSQSQMRMGLASFIMELVAPLTTAVGEAWAQGRFEVYEEHLYTEVITGVLRSAIGLMKTQQELHGPKVLLTTLPNELHGLGLLMVEAILVLEGCPCVSLGTQTPVSDILQAAQSHHADVIALSFTNVNKAKVVHASLRELRAKLPPSTDLWAGGSCAALYQQPLEGIQTVRHLEGLLPLLAQWQRSH